VKTNRSGLELIKRFEGLRLTAYLCPADVWTIGYGHTSAAGAPPVVKGMKITAQEASDILARDLAKYEAAVAKALTRTPNENQFSAMVSLCYNIGAGAFVGSSVAKRFNAGNEQGAADAFRLWNKAGGKVLPGLIRRREDERTLFLTPVVSQPKPVEPVPVPPAPTPPPAPETPPAVTQPPATAAPDFAKWVIGAAAALIAALAAWMMKG